MKETRDDHRHRPRPDLFPRRTASPGRCSGTACIAGPFYVVVSLAQALTRRRLRPEPARVEPARATASLGWIQITNFILTGADGRGGRGRPAPGAAGGPGRTWAPRLIAVYGVSLRRGRGSSAPTRRWASRSVRPRPTAVSWHGMLHFMVGGVGFLCLIAACFVLARRFAARRPARAGLVLPRHRGRVPGRVRRHRLRLARPDHAGLRRRGPPRLGLARRTVVTSTARTADRLPDKEN